MRLPPLSTLVYFEAVARLGSIAQAAYQLHISDGAISQQIRRLEAFLERKLFDRSAGTMQLTEEGREYYHTIRCALVDIHGATEQISTTPQQRVWAVSAPPSFCVQWLIPRLGDFFDCHKEINLHVQANSDHVDFTADQIDFAVRYAEHVDPGLGHHHLIKPDVMIVASPDYIEKHGQFDPQAAFDQHRFIISRPEKRRYSHLHYDWSDIIPDWDVDNLKHRLQFKEDHLAIAAARHGHGLALANRFLVAHELEQGLLFQAARITWSTKGDYYLVWPTHARASRVRDAFAEWLQQRLDRDNTGH